MKKLFAILGTIWLLPITILVWMFYILPLWALGHIKFSDWADFLVPHFVLDEKKSNSWYAKQWRDWAGVSLPNAIITKYEEGHNFPSYTRTMLHELRHCYQQWAFGPFHWLAYILSTLFIWLFLKDLHSYYDNPFEVDARRAAGQMVKIPKNMWLQGPDDRWPWW